MRLRCWRDILLRPVQRPLPKQSELPSRPKHLCWRPPLSCLQVCIKKMPVCLLLLPHLLICYCIHSPASSLFLNIERASCRHTLYLQNRDTLLGNQHLTLQTRESAVVWHGCPTADPSGITAAVSPWRFLLSGLGSNPGCHVTCICHIFFSHSFICNASLIFFLSCMFWQGFPSVAWFCLMSHDETQAMHSWQLHAIPYAVLISLRHIPGTGDANIYHLGSWYLPSFSTLNAPN